MLGRALRGWPGPWETGLGCPGKGKWEETDRQEGQAVVCVLLASVSIQAFRKVYKNPKVFDVVGFLVESGKGAELGCQCDAGQTSLMDRPEHYSRCFSAFSVQGQAPSR